MAELDKFRTIDLGAEARAIEDQDEAQQAERLERPPSREEGIRPSKIYQPLSFPVLVLLMPASVFGVLARLGIVALMTYGGDSVFPLAYAQALGCLIMGFALRLKEPIGQFYGPFYTALTTGFCGSLTTFSSWQLQVFQAWINSGQYNRNGFQNFLDGVANSCITLSLSLASLAFGYSIASILAPYFPRPRFPHRTVRYSISAFAVLLYAATYFTYFFLPENFRHQATAALLFSFPGTLTRYVLGVLLNQRTKALPLGTLTANALGSALLAAFHAVQSMNNPPSFNACSVLQGLADGYCGCLTTVSTFSAEVREFPTRKATRYVIISWLLGQAMMVLILGTPIWTGHAKAQVTCSFQLVR